ncbi:uncharacterized protein LOC126317469 isoform X2 [Schistocerca gregaria]|uniref:uncharacterized protein LOC126317469 isoform X2 n=1 Tax=Schistocerca gregaria TaxID=7010 RepID=UPI00211EBD75|nr:uncharacterized protein LOC126317469 isoform X2 [Schistocerca gregaria]
MESNWKVYDRTSGFRDQQASCVDSIKSNLPCQKAFICQRLDCSDISDSLQSKVQDDSFASLNNSQKDAKCFISNKPESDSSHRLVLRKPSDNHLKNPVLESSSTSPWKASICTQEGNSVSVKTSLSTDNVLGSEFFTPHSPACPQLLQAHRRNSYTVQICTNQKQKQRSVEKIQDDHMVFFLEEQAPATVRDACTNDGSESSEDPLMCVLFDRDSLKFLLKTKFSESLNVDEKSRQWINGTPRDSNCYSLDTCDTKERHPSLSFAYHREFAAISNVFTRATGSRSSATKSQISRTHLNIEGKKYDICNNCLDDEKDLVDLRVLELGYHVEMGVIDAKIPKAPFLYHNYEYTAYYAKYFNEIDCINYIGRNEESDTHWVVSVEKFIRREKQSYLKVLAWNGECYYFPRLDVSLLRFGLSNFTEMIRNVSMRTLRFVCEQQIPGLAGVRLSRVRSPKLRHELLSMEQKEVSMGFTYKFGVLYVKPNQTEDEIFANSDPSPAFLEFLEFLGDKIRLFGWDKFRGGLDVENQTTGEYSIYCSIRGLEIMFHVSTLLPSQAVDGQCVDRKCHIGNDIVVFVFLEEGCEPYLATKLTSKFVQVQYIIRVCPGTGTGQDNPTKYALAVITKSGVDAHLPLLLSPSIYEKTPQFRDFLLTKAINSERTALLSPEFRSKIVQSRRTFLKYIYNKYA